LKGFRQFIVPGTLQEALSLKKAVGPQGLFLAGGTTVVPFASGGVEVLINISGLGQEGIAFAESSISIGAGTRLSGLLSPEVRAALPLLYDAVRSCATPIIRNMATLGGSVASIYLPSDPAVALLALDAELTLLGQTERVVAMEDLLGQGWLSGYDIITRIGVAIPAEGSTSNFQKFGRSRIDVALVNVATVLRLHKDGNIEGLRICVGQSASRPTLLTDLCEQAVGQRFSAQLVKQLAAEAGGAVKPKADYRASSEYRKHLIEVLVGRSLVEAAEEAGFSLED
jgi:carbon-monoxide dehydrogenase medium subunit